MTPAVQQKLAATDAAMRAADRAHHERLAQATPFAATVAKPVGRGFRLPPKAND